MRDKWKCPWCGGEMTGAHPLCAEAARDQESAVSQLRTENAALTRAMREAWMAVECADRAHGEKCPEFSAALAAAKLAFETAMDCPDPLGKALVALAAVERERNRLRWALRQARSLYQVTHIHAAIDATLQEKPRD